MLPTKDPLQIQRYTQTERKEMEKDISYKWNKKKTHNLYNISVRQNRLENKDYKTRKHPVIPFLGIYPGKPKTLIQNTYALLCSLQHLQQPRECLSVGEWIRKRCYIYTMDYDSAIKKE